MADDERGRTHLVRKDNLRLDPDGDRDPFAQRGIEADHLWRLAVRVDLLAPGLLFLALGLGLEKLREANLVEHRRVARVVLARAREWVDVEAVRPVAVLGDRQPLGSRRGRHDVAVLAGSRPGLGLPPELVFAEGAGLVDAGDDVVGQLDLLGLVEAADHFGVDLLLAVVVRDGLIVRLGLDRPRRGAGRMRARRRVAPTGRALVRPVDLDLAVARLLADVDVHLRQPERHERDPLGEERRTAVDELRGEARRGIRAV